MDFTENQQNNIRILIVDDDSVTCSLLTKVLEKEGYLIEQVSSGHECLQKIESFNPQLVMLDVVMDDMNGYETCRQIRTQHNFNAISIIMLTGLNDVNSVDDAFESGANDFITKPINWALLVKRVRYAIRDNQFQNKLSQKEAMLAQAQRIAKLAYWQMNKLTQEISFSDTFYEQFGNRDLQLTSYNEYIDAIHPDDRSLVQNRFTDVLNNLQQIELDHRMLINGTVYHFHTNIAPVFNSTGMLTMLNGTTQNITQQKNTEALIEYQKHHDDITGLPNKKGLKKELNRIISKPEDKLLTAVIALGINRFSDLNDSLGHLAGEKIQRLTAERLYSESEKNTLGQYDADTYILIIEDNENIDQIEHAIAHILRILTKPFIIDQQEIYIDFHIGVSIYPIENKNADTLIANSILALNNARTLDDTKYCYHSPSMNQHAIHIRKVEHTIRHAINNNKLVLFYQPQIEVKTGRLVGAEALLRLQQEDGSLMSPLDFIPVAEDTGLIIPIGYWIFDSVCQQLQEWRKHQLNKLRIGINLSARQFTDKDLSDRLDLSVNFYKIQPESIDLEITESIALHNIDQTIDILMGFKQKGYSISLDDFGTGYSSLSSLHMLPIDVLKVDRSFIKDIGPGGINGAMAKTIINMAHNLKLSVIAEGAESKDHVEFLKQNGCDEVQGFYYSKPLPADEFLQYYKRFTKQSPDNVNNLASNQ